MCGYIAACYGILIAVAAFATLMTVLFLYFLKLSLKQKNRVGMIMGCGCSLVLFFQIALVYILINIGIMPIGKRLLSIPLPMEDSDAGDLCSSGTSSEVSTDTRTCLLKWRVRPETKESLYQIKIGRILKRIT